MTPMNEEFNPSATAEDAVQPSFQAAEAVDSAQAAIENVAISDANHAPAEAVVESVQLDGVNAPVEAAAKVTTEVSNEPNPFALLGLSPPLVQACIDLGFTTPTSVQMKTIPLAMKSQAEGAKFNDLMVSSQTGSGKTAAFLLPVLHTLEADMMAKEREEQAQWDQTVAAAKANGQEPPKRAKRKDPTNARNFKAATPGALILCPTRELAQQVSNDAIDLVRHMRGVRVATVIGGMPYQLQVAKLQNASVVVATPGRLLDLQRGGQIKMEDVKFLVVDEADRMLDLGFSDDLADINQLTIKRQQTMMFSATFESRIQQLAGRVMREPQRVTIDTPQERHNNIKQALFWADNMVHKRKLLDHWMRDESIEQAIVFASTQVECDGLANDLADAGFSAAALHGALSQALRNRRLNMLREGRIQFLVATDVAARGIDVRSISHVFNYGLPMKAEDYVHRIGRTGRAGRNGVAVTIAEGRDRRKIGEIEHYTKQRLTAEVIPGLEPTARERPFAPRGDDRGDRGGRGGFGGGGGDRGGRFGSGERSYAPREGGFNSRNSGSGWGGANRDGNRDNNRGGSRDGDNRGFGGGAGGSGGAGGGNAGSFGGGQQREQGQGFGDRTRSFNDGGYGGRPPRDARDPRDDSQPPRNFNPGQGFQGRDQERPAPRAPQRDFGGRQDDGFGGGTFDQNRRSAPPRQDARPPFGGDRAARPPQGERDFGGGGDRDRGAPKKSFGPPKTGAGGYAKTNKPKVVRVVGR